MKIKLADFEVEWTRNETFATCMYFLGIAVGILIERY